MLRVLGRPVLLLALFTATWSPALPDERQERGEARFSFALIGDTPYGSGPNSSGDEEKFDRVIDDINRDPHVAWVAHSGDIKTGSSFDTDELIRARFALYQRFNMPFLYTPGDNEWTDAHRPKEGMYNPLERLAFVRQVFFPTVGWSTGARPMPVRSQAQDPGFATFVENSMWVRSGVVFASLHVVGSNDDLDPWTGIGNVGVVPAQQAEFDARRAANLAWIDKAFALAAEIGAKGLFLFQQADPNFEVAKGDPIRKVFDPLLDKILAKTVAFGKPVLFAHGDSHFYKTDKPALDAAGHLIENFTRVENFGDANVHWVKITVDPDSRSVFQVEPVVIAANAFPH
jgi:hypothetical protein